MIKVLCVDDHQFLADGLRTRLDLEPDIEFVGWQGSAASLVAEVKRTGATTVLLDIEMPGPDPFDALADLVHALPDVRVVMLSAYVRDSLIAAALKAGAWGYLSKSDEPASVVEAIRTVAGGEFAFGPKVLEQCSPPGVPGAGGAERPTSKLDSLTARELQILRMIGKGMSRVEIAEELHRSPKTVDNHRAAIMEKLDIRDRVELARYAISEGLADV